MHNRNCFVLLPTRKWYVGLLVAELSNLSLFGTLDDTIFSAIMLGDLFLTFLARMWRAWLV